MQYISSYSLISETVKIDFYRFLENGPVGRGQIHTKEYSHPCTTYMWETRKLTGPLFFYSRKTSKISIYRRYLDKYRSQVKSDGTIGFRGGGFYAVRVLTPENRARLGDICESARSKGTRSSGIVVRGFVNEIASESAKVALRKVRSEFCDTGLDVQPEFSRTVYNS